METVITIEKKCGRVYYIHSCGHCGKVLGEDVYFFLPYIDKKFFSREDYNYCPSCGESVSFKEIELTKGIPAGY